MSDACEELELALVDRMKRAQELADARTIEFDLRECLFVANTLTKGFRPDELPAIAVSASLKPYASKQAGGGEVDVLIPLSIFVICRAERKKDAAQKTRALQAAVERLLNGFRRSDSGLGANTILTGDVTSDVVVIDEKPLRFAIGETQATVLKVMQL